MWRDVGANRERLQGGKIVDMLVLYYHLIQLRQQIQRRALPEEPVYDLDQGMQCKEKMAEKAEHTRSM